MCMWGGGERGEKEEGRRGGRACGGVRGGEGGGEEKREGERLRLHKDKFKERKKKRSGWTCVCTGCSHF